MYKYSEQLHHNLDIMCVVKTIGFHVLKQWEQFPSDPLQLALSTALSLTSVDSWLRILRIDTRPM